MMPRDTACSARPVTNRMALALERRAARAYRHGSLGFSGTYKWTLLQPVFDHVDRHCALVGRGVNHKPGIPCNNGITEKDDAILFFGFTYAVMGKRAVRASVTECATVAKTGITFAKPLAVHGSPATIPAAHGLR